MKKIFRVLLIVIILFIFVAASVALYVKTALPDIGAAPIVSVARTPQRIARGEYLANHVTACMDCHSQRDWNYYGGPLKTETFGGGGEKFGHELGFPGTLYSKNITPYGLHNWTDGEIYKAITSGESKNRYALFPLMGYGAFRKMSREDVYSIIAYVRSLPSIKNDVPPRSLDFPVNFIVNTLPNKAEATGIQPDLNNRIETGKYLVAIANCVDCHSQVDNANVIRGTEFGGGRKFGFPNGTAAYSANISPDITTGIGTWSEEEFVARFKLYSKAGYQPKKLTAADNNTPMPWMMYTGMSEKDLAAIYQYLRTVKPVQNKVVHFAKS